MTEMLSGPPPIAARLVIGLSHLGWREPAIAEAAATLSVVESNSPGAGWTARLAHREQLDLWHDGGVFVRLTPTGASEGSWQSPGPRLTDAHQLPSWLTEALPTWSVRASGIAMDRLALPGDSARERLDAATVIVGHELEGRLAAAVSTCATDSIELLIGGSSPEITVLSPPNRVTAWVTDVGVETDVADRVGFALAYREPVALHVCIGRPASVAWRLA
ncbi:MAG: hypothetical protein KC502_19895 [Myxococcales bacterium]|nr:hypothetical protein [Myxococcales bacterium]